MLFIKINLLCLPQKYNNMDIQFILQTLNNTNEFDHSFL